MNKFYETILIITNKKGHQKLTILGHSKKNADRCTFYYFNITLIMLHHFNTQFALC